MLHSHLFHVTSTHASWHVTRVSLPCLLPTSQPPSPDKQGSPSYTDDKSEPRELSPWGRQTPAEPFALAFHPFDLQTECWIVGR
ncbi:hypothetical protein B0H67DRAFT_578863 [Lasiosphaeris hirsuta]|uniref:Uncharacterized protein n=1 Tax=Lasiosphaeris hirsuta TaxID=260670 RepID=A0AA40AF72_9PEZI|nr:hypothetical protein B0H67DRAFT_578863 [Lasiosphaeris hirsuta]